MAIQSAAELIVALDRLQLLAPGQLEQLRRYQQFQCASPRVLGEQLLGCGWLTTYQFDQLLQGRGSELILGSYVLLEPIGAGAMGQVYKARHRPLDRLVALKVLRKELGGNSEVIKRFHREVRAVANLKHPNIVQALDADRANGWHFLAMEFVPGTDLGRLAQGGGPLPIATACEAIRQAAMGLDYAHARGLVHRDIKPSNLLFVKASGAAAGVLKILDLGMARLKEYGAPSAAGLLNQMPESGSGTLLTRTGNIIGTPDFMAPEQARNSHLVDGRADLYSLGCTLYTVLTQQMPFPGGTGIEKLFRHQEEEPLPLEQHRPEIPPTVVLVVSKLMAKSPADRYQTGGEAAAALGGLLARRCDNVPGTARIKGGRTTLIDDSKKSAQTTKVGVVKASKFATAARAVPRGAAVASRASPAAAKKLCAARRGGVHWKRWIWWAVGVGIVASCLLACLVMFALLMIWRLDKSAH